MKPLLLTLVVAVLVAFGNDPQADKVDALFAQWNKPESPGCALAIIRDGRVVYKRGYGIANLEYDIPISSKTVFNIGSISKQFTAMSIAILARQGKLSLDDDIRKYLPEMPQYSAPVTIRQLIYHTSGIREYSHLMQLAGTRFQDATADEDYKMIARHCSGFIFVVQWGRTSQRLVRECLSEAAAIKDRVLCVVLNKVDPAALRSIERYKGDGFQNYYTEQKRA